MTASNCRKLLQLLSELVEAHLSFFKHRGTLFDSNTAHRLSLRLQFDSSSFMTAN